MDDFGINKSAVLFLALGEDEGAEVLKLLGPREVQKIGTTMAGIKSLPREQVQPVLTELLGHAEDKGNLGVDADAYVRSMLLKALGSDRAAPLVERLFGNDNAGFEGLKWMDASTIAELIHNEHPQIIASILVHLERDQACEILTLFTERLRNDVVLRIATLDGMQPSALIELNDVLRQMVSGGAGNLKKSSMGGVHVAAEILNFMPASIEGKLMEHLQQTDGDMAEKIMNEMFVFDNILEIDDRGIQVLLREVQTDSLVLALKGTTEDLRQKIFRNMSSRAAEALKEDLESRGPVKVAEVEAQQKEILKIVRRLGEEGQIQLGGKGEDSYV